MGEQHTANKSILRKAWKYEIRSCGGNMGDIVAYTEVYKESLCLLATDFKEAFDRISHSCLYTILREFGFSEEFCKRIQGLYANVTSTLNINVNRSQPIPIQSSVRQGCPLSMSLFVLCLNPLLNALE